jgi:large subunit ribosomal protein L28
MLALASISRLFSSNRSQLGLWHGKDIRTGRTYTFSHKANLRLFKPNVIDNKKFWSHILERWIKITVTTKALKCIEKKGNFDNYVMNTPERDLRSKYGEMLRALMVKKLAHPEE